MTQTVLVIGGSGKLGKVACNLLDNAKTPHHVVSVTRAQCIDSQIRKHKPAFAIELTNCDSVYVNSLRLLEAAVPTIVGASGLSSDDCDQLNRVAEQSAVPCLVVPNFSIAAALMNQAVKLVAQHLPDCEIIEYHHAGKKDAPSATSLNTAALMRHNRESQHSTLPIMQTLNQTISIHSIRSQGFLARQDVIFGQAGESLAISLNQIDRCAFEPGILLAAQVLLQLEPGLHHGIEAVMNVLIANPSRRYYEAR